jgi:hypothetical protein
MKSTWIRSSAVIGLLSLLAIACSDRRGITPSFTPPDFVTYTTDMKPLFDASCTGCHGGSSPAGSYDMTTYAGILANGTDAVPNAIPGDAGSLLITKIQAGHFAWSGDQTKIDLLIQWVVQDSCREN